MEGDELEVELRVAPRGAALGAGVPGSDWQDQRGGFGADDAQLDALLCGAEAFAPLPDSGQASSRGSDGTGALTGSGSLLDDGVTTLEDRSGHSAPAPRGHMAVVDRLYKWEQRRSAKLSKARREEDLRQARAQRTSCTFRPSVTKPAAPQPDPGPHVPGASPLRSPSAAPPDADVFSRLQQQQERREERRRLLVDRAMAAAAETCTFSPAISAKGRRSGGRATPLLRDIDRHESDYAASLAEAKEAAPVVVSERQGEALAAYLRRARQAAALRHQRLAVPRADGTGFTSRPVHVGAPASPDGPRPHGSPGQRRPPHRSPGQRRPSPAQGSAAVGKAHGRFAGDVAQALRRARPADPPAAPRSPDRVAALHELRAVERYVLGPHGVQAEAPAAAPAPAVTEPAAPAPFDLPAVARALALSAGVPVVPVPVLRGSPARAARGAAAPSQPGAGPSPAGPAGTGSPLPQTYRLSQTGPARWVPAEPREPARDEASGAAAAASGAPSDAVPASVMLRRARQVEGRAAAAARAEKARRDTMEGRLPVQAGESMEALHARMQALRAELAAEKAAASSPSRTSRGPGVGAPAAGAPASMEPVGVAPRADAGPSRVLYSVSDLTHRSPSSRVPLAEPQTLIEAIQHHAASRRSEAQWRSVQEHIERHARLRPESPAAERRA